MGINKWLVLREIHKHLFKGISRIYSEIKGGNTLANRGYDRSSCRVLGKLGTIIVCFMLQPWSSPFKRE